VTVEPVAVDKVLQWTGGSVLQRGSARSVTSVSTDSRTLRAGACFVALAGERFDGHDFAADAAARGAAAVLVRRDKPVPVPPGVWVISVEDTAAALGRIAGGYRRMFDIPVAAVTGSNGKTTTKEMAARILSAMGPVLKTEKNYNNEIGVPLTLLGLERGHRAAVVEMGMRGPGQIAALAEIARPTVGVVTNVGPVHMEFFRSVEDVARAKAELVEALESDGFAVLNADDPRVRAMRRLTRARVVTFGLDPRADVGAERVEHRGLEGSRFILRWPDQRVPVMVKLPGRHQVHNALAAAAVAWCLGLDARAVQQGLIDVRTEMRMALRRLGADVLLIDDAYNASPLSVRAALESLGDVRGRRRVAVLGGMLELGDLAESAHREMGRTAVKAGVDFLVAVGTEARWILDEAIRSGLDPGRALWFEDAARAAEAAPEWSAAGDVILVKGSRGFRLEIVSAALVSHFGERVESEAEESL